MLTIAAILKTTRQMTAFGERGTSGALDHLPARVQGQKTKKKADSLASEESQGEESEWRWDDEQNTYVQR